MPRPNRVWKRKQTGWYYATIGGKKTRLSLDREEAERMMHRLLAEQSREEDASPRAVIPTFKRLADMFLDHSERANKHTTYRMHRLFLQSFCDAIRNRRVADLKVHHVTQWLAGKGWNESTQCSARSTVLAVLNWGVEQGYLKSHPLARLKRGSHRRRERLFTPGELRRIREFTNPRFAEFLLGLELTGARPYSELAKVTAAMVDWGSETISFPDHKNARKLKTRTIYLVPEMVALLRRLAERHPTGPLFRNTRDKEWTSHDATRRLHFCTDRLGIPRGTIYAVRHYVITGALERGLNANVIAELVGNSPVTISRHYDHLSKQRAAMKEAAKRAISPVA